MKDATRRFSLREGVTAADDRLPARLTREPIEEGRRIAAADVERMVARYYRLRGWDENGVPTGQAL